MHMQNEKKGIFLYVLGVFLWVFFPFRYQKIEDVRHTAVKLTVIKQAVSANTSVGIAFFLIYMS